MWHSQWYNNASDLLEQVEEKKKTLQALQLSDKTPATCTYQ